MILVSKNVIYLPIFAGGFLGEGASNTIHDTVSAFKLRELFSRLCCELVTCGCDL